MPSDEQDSLQSLIADFLEAENRVASVNRDALLSQYPEHADSLRDFFANHDRMKSAADQEDPTLPPNESGLADPTLPPNPGNLEAVTMPPRADGDDPTMPHPSSEGATVGDQVRYFGDYELLEEIARGGMGIVFKVRQINLNRIVALKMILAGQFAGEEDVQRFYTEAEAAAQLDHPGIVPIFEIGEHQGQHYFSMGYVEGDSLAQRVADRPLPPREAAELARKICDAMAYAHKRGVIHRDLKPANILIDENGQPKVTDFGLAKKTEADSDLTGTGQILGTPAYMPPEQASGKTDIGPLADVYSLGAILYCLLTGRPPFQAANPMDTLIQVLEKEPVAPRVLNETVPRDLETICLKCLSKEAKKRYESSADLGLELQRFLNGEPIHARPVGSLEKSWRWCTRNRAIASLLALLLTSLVGGTAFATFFAITATNQKQRAEQRLYANHISSAQRAWETNDYINAWTQLNGCDQSLRGWEHDYLYTRFSAGYINLLGHPPQHDIHCVAFSNDGSKIASGGGRFVENRRKSSLRIWDASSGRELLALDDRQFPIRGLAFSSDGKLVVAGCEQGWIMIWDAVSGALKSSIHAGDTDVASVVYSSDDRWIISGHGDGTVRIWDADAGKEASTLTGHAAAVKSVAISEDGMYVVSGSEDATLRIWDVESRKLQHTLKGHSGSVNSVAIDPVGNHLVSGSRDQTIKVWDITTGREKLTVTGHSSAINAVAFSPDGEHILSGGGSTTTLNANELRIWSSKDGRLVQNLRGHTSPITGVAFSPDSSKFVASSMRLNLKLWDSNASPQSQLLGHGSSVLGVALTPDGRQIVSGGADKRVIVWDAKTGEKDKILEGHTGSVTCVASNPNGQSIASGSADRTIRIWDLVDTTEASLLSGHSGPVSNISFSPDGNAIASSSSDRNVMIWDSNTGERLWVLRGHDDIVTDVEFSPDGTLVASVSEDSTLRIWDIETHELIIKLSEPLVERSGAHSVRVADPIYCVAFSPNGRWIAIGGDGKAELWDVSSGRNILTMETQSGRVNSVVFNTDGTRLMTGGRLLEVWDTGTGHRLTDLTGHSSVISDFAFHRDNNLLVSGSWDSSVRLWSAQRSQPEGAAMLMGNANVASDKELLKLLNRR